MKSAPPSQRRIVTILSRVALFIGLIAGILDIGHFLGIIPQQIALPKTNLAPVGSITLALLLVLAACAFLALAGYAAVRGARAILHNTGPDLWKGVTSVAAGIAIVWAIISAPALLGHVFGGSEGDQGNVVWTHNLGAQLPAKHAVANGRLYIVVGNNSDSAKILCLSAADSSLLWQFALQPSETVSTNLIILNGSTYFGTGYSLSQDSEAVGGAVYELSSDGHLAWRFIADNGDVDGIALGQGRVFATTGNGASYADVYSLDASTGREVWGFRTPNWNYFEVPTTQGSDLYAIDNDSVFVFDAIGGRLIWRYYREYSAFQSFAVFNGDVIASGYFGTTALSSRDGSVLWTFATAGTIWSEGGLLLLGGYDKTIYRLNPTTGAILWKIAEHYGAYYMALLNGVIYVGTCVNAVSLSSNPNYGATYALNADSGSPIWTFNHGDVIAIEGSVIYIAEDIYMSTDNSENSNLYALDLASAEPKWNVNLGSLEIEGMDVASGIMYVEIIKTEYNDPSADAGAVEAIRN